MSTTDEEPGPAWRRRSLSWAALPAVPAAMASLLVTVVVALFLLTFVLQPYLIPSESMEHTLLVGDFLLVNKQVYAPSDPMARSFLPYREVARGDIVIFHPPNDPAVYYIKRVVGVPGDRLSIVDGHVFLDDRAVDEPYATFEPAPRQALRDDLPAKVYTDPEVDPAWWRQMRSQTRGNELAVPQGEYFMLGDNRNYSKDSRFWGFVPRGAIVARPLLIYFSLLRPSATDVKQAADDRLGHDGEITARFFGFARWKRIFQVVH
jgi:signal peptidase I